MSIASARSRTTTPPTRARWLATAGLGLGAALAVASGTSGCGASIQAVYESDVRFEHCMALDTRVDVKAELQRGCWDEWLRYYTFGQTRDRVEHARLRVRQLGTAGDYAEGGWHEAQRTAAAVPEPTSALAPPPMMLATAAPPAASVAPAAPSADARAGSTAPPGAACTGECDEQWKVCQRECRSPTCDKGCTAKYKRCMRRCF